MRSARTLLGLALLLACGAAQAEPSDPVAKAAGVRAKLPAPGPWVSLDYEGDVVIDGLWAGEVHYTMRSKKVGAEVLWRTTERLFMDWKGVETRRTTMLHLAKDLSIISGSAELRREDETVALVISRTAKGFFIQRRKKKGDDWQAPELLDMKAPRDATHGNVALLLFLRSMPERDTKTHYELPRAIWPFTGKPKAVEPYRIRVHGPSEFMHERAKARKSWVATFQAGTTSGRMHLLPNRSAFLGAWLQTAQGAFQIVPRGEGGERLKLEEHKPAKTWKAAFLKFGYGYHQARRNLLDAAFHWGRFYEHETKVLKRWDKARPVEEFRKAWIDEFCANSKHRSLANTKRLLNMTLQTGKVKKRTDDEIVFAAHANFGGGTQRTYYLERRDGFWGIVRIDFEE